MAEGQATPAPIPFPHAAAPPVPVPQPVPFPQAAAPQAPLPMAPASILTGEEIRKPDLQVLLQNLATSQRTLFEERRYFERRLADEQKQSRWEQDRVRAELGDKLRESDRQIEVLIRTLGRIQGENDRLREDLAVARIGRNGHSHAATEPAAPAPVPAPAPPSGAGVPIPRSPKAVAVAVASPQAAMPMVAAQAPPVPTLHNVAVVPAPDPFMTGRPIGIIEPPGRPPGAP